MLTAGGVLVSRLPYPEGNWVTKNVQPECSPGRAVKLGTFKSTDFTPNAFERTQTAPVPLALTSGEFVSKVIMSGGFYDPRAAGAHGVNGMDGLCVRSVDPSVIEAGVNPPFGNSGRPVGCVANSRIADMPAGYSISATSAHPSVDVLSSDSGDPLGTVPYGTSARGHYGSGPEQRPADVSGRRGVEAARRRPDRLGVRGQVRLAGRMMAECRHED